MKTKIHPLKAIRSAAVSLCAFETADPAATVKGCIKLLTENKKTQPPMLRWDCCLGIEALNDDGQAILGNHFSGMDAFTPLDQIIATLAKVKTEEVVCFAANLHRFITNDAVMQSIWNLRDAWKVTGATFIMLCPAMTLPTELKHDVVVINEPLPDKLAVEEIVDHICSEANLDVSRIENKEKVVDTLLGVSAFAAEQVLSMSLSRDGINQETLWEHKRKMVEQTPGLAVWKGTGSMKDVGGMDNLKDFFTSLLTSGNNPIRCIGFIDEIEKLFAGASGDLSGVSQDQLRTMLTEMQDNDIRGVILVGPAGTGKSIFSKMAGSIADAEVITIDTGAMTGSLVGESQAKIRAAFATFKAVSQGKGMFIATCNKIASLPPELRRRFSLGTYYVDLPNAKEREVIWKLKMTAYGIDAQTKPDDEGWTGAEIEACCDIAHRCAWPLKRAAGRIVPVSKSAADAIDSLRKQANGNFISANYEGVYQYNRVEPIGQQTTGRRLSK